MANSETGPDADQPPLLRLVRDTAPVQAPDLGAADEPGELSLDAFDGDLEFLLVPLLTEAEQQMRTIERPLDAEMWASELLGMLELDGPDESTPAEREEVTLNLATRLADYAVDQASASGLAILRTLSVIGPQEARELAREEALHLRASGLADQSWAGTVGRPVPVRAWGFVDPNGTQESVTVVFNYSTGEHCLNVLIDHRLGGGVRDCWVSEDPTAVLAEARDAVTEFGITIEPIPVAAGLQILQTALTRPECPRTPEEIEDVALSRALLRTRVDLLT